MKPSLFRDCFAKKNAAFSERFGAQVVSRVSDQKTEYLLVRDGFGLTDVSYMHRYSFPEDKGLDFLDALCAGNVAKVRFGRMLHTFIADEAGDLVADCYVANNDEQLVLLAESIMDDAAFKSMLLSRGAADAGMTDLSETHALLSVDGYKAWAVVKGLFGADVLGLPYLSVERYEFSGQPLSLFRAGKTSEFGYYLLAPAANAQDLFDACMAHAAESGGGPCGVDIHNDLRLEGRFFNIFAEGATVCDPLPLGLQWMIDFGKESFCGSKAIFERRAKGLSHKIIGVSASADANGFSKGAAVFNGSRKAGDIVAACFSHVLGAQVGLALLPVDIAFSGLAFSLGSKDGPEVQTISMPPIMPKSLTVKLDEL
jgi:aminomethyltransferase